MILRRIGNQPSLVGQQIDNRAAFLLGLITLVRVFLLVVQSRVLDCRWPANQRPFDRRGLCFPSTTAETSEWSIVHSSFALSSFSLIMASFSSALNLLVCVADGLCSCPIFNNAHPPLACHGKVPHGPARCTCFAMNTPCFYHSSKYGVCYCPLVPGRFHFSNQCRDRFPHYPLPCGCSHGIHCDPSRHGKSFSPLTEGGWELAYLDAKLDANRKEYDIAVTRERGTELEEERLQLYLKGASLVGERLAKRRKIQ